MQQLVTREHATMASSWNDDDDDLPPPLSSLSEQVEAMRIRESTASACSPATPADSTQLRTATCTVQGATGSQPARTATSQKTAIKKGFFDSKPASKKTIPDDGMPTIKAQKRNLGSSGAAIPDFLKVQPADVDTDPAGTVPTMLKFAQPQQKPMTEKEKQELFQKIRPTQKTVELLQTDPILKQGLDDPEIRAALDDVSKNPDSKAKYANNAKVAEFFVRLTKAMVPQQ